MAAKPLIIIFAALKAAWTIKSTALVVPSYNMVIEDIDKDLQVARGFLPEDQKHLIDDIDTRVWKRTLSNFKLFFTGFLTHEVRHDPRCFVAFVVVLVFFLGLLFHMLHAIGSFLLYWVLLPSILCGFLFLIDSVRDGFFSLLGAMQKKTDSVAISGRGWVERIIIREKDRKNVKL